MFFFNTNTINQVKEYQGLTRAKTISSSSNQQILLFAHNHQTNAVADKDAAVTL